MDGEAVQAIVEAARSGAVPKPFVLEGPGYKKLVHAIDHGTETVEWQFIDLPHLMPAGEVALLHTLSGLADFVSANRDERVLTECLVVVRDHTRVLFVGRERGELPQRDLYAAAQFEDLIKTAAPGIPNAGAPFGFGAWMSPDSFNIALQSMFVANQDRGRVLEICGNVRTEGVTTWDDDGVTQGVVAAAGVKIGKVVGVPNPVKLAPYRTFREVEQPESLFVLRMRGQPGELPMVALFEADGGAWKVEAIERIAEYLQPLLPADVVVVA